MKKINTIPLDKVINKINKFSQTKIKRRIKLLWLLLSIFGLVGIVAASISTLIEAQQDVDPTRVLTKGWLYFTFISNFLIFTYGFLRYTRLIDENNRTVIFLKNLIATSITITCVVSWTLLVKDEIKTLSDTNTPIKIVSRLFNHTFNPIFFIFLFLIDNKQFESKSNNALHGALKIVIFPVSWLILATIIYFALGGQKEDAFYSFLAFSQNKWYMTLIYVIGISLAFGLFGYLYVRISIIKCVYFAQNEILDDVKNNDIEQNKDNIIDSKEE